jgi:LysR family cys regulon transcriptional activator
MKLRQLHYIVEVCRQCNNISAAAEALHTSQPGLSKQIQLLEAELGFALFRRTRNKVIGLTQPGEEVIRIARRIMNDVHDLRAIRNHYAPMEDGQFAIATTHTYARYVVPPLVDGFLKKYPRVKVRLLQSAPEEACRAVERGEADMAVCTSAGASASNVVMMPSFAVGWTLIAKKGHPILDAAHLSLAEMARYRVITHDPGHGDHCSVLRAFEAHGLDADVVFSAVDAEITKTYVKLGLGIAVLPAIAVDPVQDQALGARDAGRLFEPGITHVCVRPQARLRDFVFDFIHALDPGLTPDIVRAAIEAAVPAAQSRAARGRKTEPPSVRRRGPAHRTQSRTASITDASRTMLA